MSQEKPKKAKLKGFAMLIGGLLNSVKDTEECKEIIKGERTRVLLNNKENKWAALITIDNDEIRVECVKTTPKENISRSKLRWWGYWEFPNLQTMMSASSWKSGKWIRKMASGKVKGASQIALLGKILALARPPAPPEEKKK